MQILGGDSSALGVVDTDAVFGPGGIIDVEVRDVVAKEHVPFTVDEVKGEDQQCRELRIENPLNDFGVVFFVVEDDEVDSESPELLVDRFEDLEEVVVSDIREQEPHRRLHDVVSRQLGGGGASNILSGLDDVKNPLARILGHMNAVVEYPGHGPDPHPRLPSDIFNGYLAHAKTIECLPT